MNHINEIEHSLREAWSAGGRVYITAQINGNHDNVYPLGHERQFMGSPIYTVNLSIGLSACKLFQLNVETGMFDYDICVGGKPFFGSLHPNSIMGISNPDTNVCYGAWIPEPAEPTAPTTTGLRLVACNPDVVPQKSKAKMHLVH
ncbi:hypothetical protein NVP3058O_069 [Vibrio phage 3.058.O._10N.286.46.B8]|nr:hypothetical protein NVP2058O_070 [Vibrio phage 2.058.O._10N.286.46.B8]AUS03139.1 hypothetical protein NVP3058O_069 [Vibrio phage 3.058.O._10N.286.46.B8]